MEDNFAITINDEEFAELKRLVDVTRNAEDVQYAAFLTLCPTGEEGAFDEHMCEIYRALHEAGMIEGDSDGDAFYFRALTDEGVCYVEHIEEGFEAGLWNAHLSENDEEGKIQSGFHVSEAEKSEHCEELEAQSDTQHNSQDASSESSNSALAADSHRITAGSLIAVAVLGGLIAGFIGGIAGAYIFGAFLS